MVLAPAPFLPLAPVWFPIVSSSMKGVRFVDRNLILDLILLVNRGRAIGIFTVALTNSAHIAPIPGGVSCAYALFLSASLTTQRAVPWSICRLPMVLLPTGDLRFHYVCRHVFLSAGDIVRPRVETCRHKQAHPKEDEALGSATRRQKVETLRLWLAIRDVCAFHFPHQIALNSKFRQVQISSCPLDGLVLLGHFRPELHFTSCHVCYSFPAIV